VPLWEKMSSWTYYEAMMNVLTTLLEECNKPIKPDNIIRVFKAQYDKQKAIGNSQDN
jgi:hypothetical protein